MSEWQPIESAPRDGTRVRLSHALDPNSQKVETFAPTYGVFEDGEWQCNNAFTCIDGYLRWQPTAWMPLPTPPTR